MSADASNSENLATIPQRFQTAVERGPDRLAVKTSTQCLTFADLDRRANRVGNLLAERGLTNLPIGLFITEPVNYLTTMLGVAKAGCIFVPLDPTFPSARTRFMLEHSTARLIFTDDPYHAEAVDLVGDPSRVINIDRLPHELPDANPRVPVSPDAIAYILYTSGSTGRPKGVMQTHANLLHFVGSYSKTLAIKEDDRLTMFYSFSFSASLMDIFGALTNGAALLPYDIKRAGIADLAAWLEREEITIYHSVPTVFRHFLSSLGSAPAPRGIRGIDLGGEPVYPADVELFRQHFRPPCIMVNHLAFTEASVSAQYVVRHDTVIDDAVLPVGADSPGVELRIVDENGKETQQGEAGEILVRGRFVSPGYWSDPDLTSVAFSLDTSSGLREYRTGDLGRRRPDGLLVHLGRGDSRVKIRGHSVEPAEIEQALLRQEGIREAVVVAHKDQGEDARLVAYVVSRGAGLDRASLRRALANELPHFMVPSTIQLLDALPMTPTGKVDRRSLPAPVPEPEPKTAFVRDPDTVHEQAVAEIWAAILGKKFVGTRDDFFELGGDSLAAVRMLAEIERTLGVRLPPSVLVQSSRVDQLAARLEEEHRSQGQPVNCLVPLTNEGPKPAIFLIPPAARTVLIYHELVASLDKVRPVYAFQHRGMDGIHPADATIEQMATRYVEAMREARPTGPYHLVGMCFGGIVAYEMACQLLRADAEIGLLAVLDAQLAPGMKIHFGHRMQKWFGYYRERLRIHLREGTIRDAIRRGFAKKPAAPPKPPGTFELVRRAHFAARARYQPVRYPGEISFFKTASSPESDRSLAAWSRLTDQKPKIITIPGRHDPRADPFIRAPHVQYLAEKLSECLERAESYSTSAAT